MKNRIRVLLLALLLAVGISCGGLSARAEDVYSEGPLYYTVGNESVTIVGCFGKHEEIEVPAMIAGYPVNTIASGAFTGNEYLKILKLPDTISRIEAGAIDPGIYVIYNANTDHPQDTPTDLILGLLDPVPSETEEPAPAENPPEEPPEETPEPVSQGSGEGDLDEEESGTPITEREGELDGPEETPEPTAAPEESPAPTEAPAEEKAEETPRPEQPAEERPEADTESADTSAEPEAAEGKREQTGALAWALAGVAVLTGGGWLLAKRKKTED